jgi:hypothetical protein
MGYGGVLRVCSDAANSPGPDGSTGTGLHHESGRNTLTTDWPSPCELAGTDMSGLLIRGFGVRVPGGAPVIKALNWSFLWIGAFFMSTMD